MMAEKPLSKRQKAMLAFIEEFTLDNGYPPTIREIGEACDIPSTSVVNYNLNRLQERGHLERNQKVSRGLRLTRPQQETNSLGLIRVPVLGRIVASAPAPVPGSDFSYYSEEDTLEVTSDIVSPDENLFALQVQGDSMVDAMINDGDYVIMKPWPTPSNGDMVAVWLVDKEETTLKRFYLENGRVRLQPENSAMAPIYIDDPSTVQIQGRVVAVVRTIH